MRIEDAVSIENKEAKEKFTCSFDLNNIEVRDYFQIGTSIRVLIKYC